MIEQYGLYFGLAGVVLLTIGWLWMVVRAFRHRLGWRLFVLLRPPAAPFYGLRRLPFVRGPMIVLALGAMVTAAPLVYSCVVPVDLGPYDTIVAGERHLTLSG